MEFILSPNFIHKLNHLKESYESIKHIDDLSQAPQPYSISTLFGATNVEARYQQIVFLSGLSKFLDKHYKISEEVAPLTSDIDIENRLLHDQMRLSATRCLVTACLFIQSMNSSGSTLNKLIAEALGNTDKNIMDKATLACCFKSTGQFLKSGDLFDRISAFLASHQSPSLCIDLYRAFTRYNDEQAALKIFSGFPVTNMVYPVFVNPMRTAGYASGAMIGELLTRSTTLMSANYKVTAALGGGMYMLLGTRASTGVFFMAPTLAENFVRNYLTIAMAWLCGHAAGLIGATLAYSIGISADVSWMLVMGSSRYAYKAIYGKALQEQPSGMSLIDGQLVENGIKIELLADDKIKSLQQIEFTVEKEDQAPVARHKDALLDVEAAPYMAELKAHVTNQSGSIDTARPL